MKDGQRRIHVYTKETYDRKIEVTRTTSKPDDNKGPLIPANRPPIMPPFNDAQVHTSSQNADTKIVDGKYVRTETFQEHLMKEDNKDKVEPAK